MTDEAGSAVAVTLRARDGVPLCGRLVYPARATTEASGGTSGRPRVAVALSHAMMVDRRTLDMPPGQGLLSQLVGAGAAVLCFDQRGHGESRPRAAEGARWDYDTLVDDAGVAASFLADRFPGVPRVAVGHSLFGHVALAYQARLVGDPAWAAGRPSYDGLVLLAANVWLPGLEPRRWRLAVKRVTYALFQAAGRPLGYLPVRRLRLGTADEPYPYLAQMGQWLPDGDWRSRDGFSYLGALGQLHTPLLSVVGAGDRLMAVPDCQLRLVGRLAGQVTHITVGRRFGDPCDPDHMGVVLDRRLVGLWRQIAGWVAGCGIVSSS